MNVQAFIMEVPVLGVCYGAQLTAKRFGGRVEKSNKREYGRALLHKQKNDVLLKDVMEKSQVWMSHADTILELPEGFELLATTESIPIAAFKMSLVRSRESRVTSHESELESKIGKWISEPDSYRVRTPNFELSSIRSAISS